MSVPAHPHFLFFHYRWPRGSHHRDRKYGYYYFYVCIVNGKLIVPDYKSAVAIQSNYTCMTNGYVIGTIQGAVNGWASIRSSKNANYFLALCTSSENPIAVCIPFASGDSVIFGSSGTYNLAFAPAK